MERVRKLLFEEWIPRLEELSAAHEGALERQRSIIGGSSRTKMPQVEAIGKELADVEEKVAENQQLYVECVVKMLRGNPVRARLTLTDALFDCNANLSAEEARGKALDVRCCS